MTNETQKTIKYFSMFTGIGGFELGIERATTRSIRYVEYSSEEENFSNPKGNKPTQHNTYDSANQSKYDRLNKELLADITLACPYRLAQADFARALRHGSEHHVHNADTPDEERYATNGRKKVGKRGGDTRRA